MILIYEASLAAIRDDLPSIPTALLVSTWQGIRRRPARSPLALTARDAGKYDDVVPSVSSPPQAP